MSEFRDTRVAEEGEIVSTEAPNQVNVGQSIADAIRQRKGLGAEPQKPMVKQAAPREVAPEPAQTMSLDRPKSAKRKKLYEKPTPLTIQPKKKETLAQLFTAIVKKKLGKGIL